MILATRFAAFVLAVQAVAGAAAAQPPAGLTPRERAAALKQSGDLSAARAVLVAAIADAAGNPPLAGALRHDLGWIAFETEGEDAARAEWDRALDVLANADERQRLRVLADRVFVTPPGAEKRALIEQGLEGARARHDASLEAIFLQRLGQQQMWDGRYLEAIVSLRAAIDRFDANGQSEAVAHALSPLARLYQRHGRPDLARESRLRAAALFTQLGGADNAARAEDARAQAAYSGGNLRTAIDRQRQAIALARRTQARRYGDQLELQLAWWLLESGDHDAARGLSATRATTGDPLIRSLAWHPLAAASVAAGRYADAIDAATRALDLAIEPAARPELLAVRARARAGARQHEAALIDVHDAITIVEQMRSGLVPLDSMKQGMAEVTSELFDLAVGLTADSGDAAQALTFAEQARSRAFLDLLASRRERAAVSAAIDSGGTLVADVPSDGQGHIYTRADYAALAGRTGATVVAYWVGPRRSFVWVIAPSGTIRIAPLAIGSARLLSLVNATRPPASGGQRAAEQQPLPGGAAVIDVATRSDSWGTLHRLLIEPIAAWLPHSDGALLTIVPHGPLSQLSFAALRDSQQRYLVERFALHYLPAGAAMDVAAAAAPDRVLVVGVPERFPRSPGVRLGPLPGAHAEAREVARRFASRPADVLSGSLAGERAIRDAMPSAGMIHVATHAVLDTRHPFDAFLALQPGTGASQDDGRLTVEEIYRLRFSAQVVVLSACGTASGRVAGDGVAGFARAFLTAGVSTVVAGLWDVPDLSSARLMRDFYARFDRGSARALRLAQLQMIASLRSGQVTATAGAGQAIVPEDPALWAGFVVFGRP